MRRVFRAFYFLIVMIAYCADMIWRGRKMAHQERMKFVARRQRIGCVHLTRILNISCEVRGSLPTDQATLLVSNHIGTLDPWIVAANMDVAFVAKSEMGSWPVLSWVCEAVGVIFAHRRNVMKTTQTVDEIRARMRSGVAVVIFPEGTTSDGTDLLPFKTAGLESVANMEDGCIVPMYFHVRTIRKQTVDLSSRKLVTWYAPQAMKANLWQVLSLGPMHFVIRIGEPISAAGKDRKELAKASRIVVERLKKEEEAELEQVLLKRNG